MPIALDALLLVSGFAHPRDCRLEKCYFALQPFHAARADNAFGCRFLNDCLGAFETFCER
jgi:hypothetical protein